MWGGTNRQLVESVMFISLLEHGCHPEMEKVVWRGGEA